MAEEKFFRDEDGPRKSPRCVPAWPLSSRGVCVDANVKNIVEFPQTVQSQCGQRYSEKRKRFTKPSEC